MIFSKINLKTELIRRRNAQQALLDEVHMILEESSRKDEEVLQRLYNGFEKEVSTLYADPADEIRVFDIAEIQKLCIRYRLRFLSSSHFRSEYPYAAIAEIRAFERKYSTKIEEFYIAAPEHTFNLENINKDPLLFARLGERNFYLIHQWGNDLPWYKKFTLWPLQTFKTLFITLWFLAAALAFVIPSSIINISSFEAEMYLRLWLTVHCFIAFFGFTVWAGFTFDKTVSSKNWNSKYYND